MAEFPALPLWTDAYLGDTSHLTTIEHGAYLLLLMVAWRSKETRLPDDDKLLARYARCTAGQWTRIRPILEPFFRVEDGFWTQGRLTDEAVAVRQKRQSQADNGRASALKRKGRHSTKREPNVNEASTPTTTPTTVVPSNEETTAATDPEKVMFDSGIRLLKAAGRSEPNARSLIAKWRKAQGSAAVIEALGAAQREGAIDPASFIEGRWRHRAREPVEGFQI